MTDLHWAKMLADNWRGRNGNSTTGDSVRNSCADELEKVAARNSAVPQPTQQPDDRDEQLRQALAAMETRTEETDQQFEDRLQHQDAADNLRLLDHIADKIGLPHNEEMSRENFNAWQANQLHQFQTAIETLRTVNDVILKELKFISARTIEAAAGIADAKAADEIAIIEQAADDRALSDTGRISIQDRALARKTLAQTIAREIRRIPSITSTDRGGK